VDDFYRVIALTGAGLIALSALWTVARLQREHPFSMLSTLTAGAGAAVSLVIYILIIDFDLKDEAVWGLLAGGALAGALFGARIPLYRRADAIVSRAAGWHLALPAAAIAAFQVMGVRESVDGIILSFAALYAATGFAVAACALLLVRSLGLRPVAARTRPQAAPAAAAPTGQCSHCGSHLKPNWRYCMACGAPL
jgi:uncharacterized membrane protein